MSHYYALVCLPPGFPEDQIEEGVAKMMAPYSEDLEIEPVVKDGEVYWTNPRSFWDWWQIGGRWTGHLVEDYDPESDPDNIEACFLCHGTGTRTDRAVANGCNGCAGTGRALKWPTQWARHKGDVQTWRDVKASVLADKQPYTVIAGEVAAHRERYDPDAPHGEWFKETGDVLPVLEALPDDAIVVVVDYHC